MSRLIFDMDGWEDYIYWQHTDKKKSDKLNALIKDALRNPYQGIGKPEPLKGNYRGYWSRRLDGEHRLVYGHKYGVLTIIACRYHYKSN